MEEKNGEEEKWEEIREVGQKGGKGTNIIDVLTLIVHAGKVSVQS